MRRLIISKFSITIFVVLIIVSLSCTKDELADVKTKEVGEVGYNYAVSGGSVVDEGSSSVVERGIVWCTAENPSINIYLGITKEGSGKGEFESNITDLEPGYTYYVRAYATSDIGTSYGEQYSFKTNPFPPISACENYPEVQDIEGNTYKTVQIGEQCWFAENLRVTTYNTGEDIIEITEDSEWGGSSTPAFCWYNNDENTYGKIYGALYNWFAVQTGDLCPQGWRVATDTDWMELSEYLGGEFVAGGILKKDSELWNEPNEGASNMVGFNAIPGGDRHFSTGEFGNVEKGAYWWTFPESVGSRAWAKSVHYNHEILYTGYIGKSYGFSVRCIKKND